MIPGQYFLDLLEKIDRDNDDALFLIAEIGSKSGRTSKTLLSNPNVYLLMVDIWRPTPDYPRWPLAQCQEFKKQALAVTDFAVNRREIIEKTSQEAAEDVDFRSLDMVLLDANHDYTNTLLDMVRWYQRLRVGGVVVGRFYNKIEGTTLAVDLFCKEYRVELHTDESGHGWWLKKI